MSSFTSPSVSHVTPTCRRLFKEEGSRARKAPGSSDMSRALWPETGSKVLGQ